KAGRSWRPDHVDFAARAKAEFFRCKSPAARAGAARRNHLRNPRVVPADERAIRGDLESWPTSGRTNAIGTGATVTGSARNATGAAVTATICGARKGAASIPATTIIPSRTWATANPI